MTKYIPDADRENKNTNVNSNSNSYSYNNNDNDNVNDHPLSNVALGKPMPKPKSTTTTTTAVSASSSSSSSNSPYNNIRSNETIYNKLKTLSNENVVRSIIRYGGQGDILSNINNQYTLFAPTDHAFEFLPDGVFEYLKGSPRETGYVIRSHIISGKYTTAEFHDSMSLSSMDGSKHFIAWVGNGGGSSNIDSNNTSISSSGHWTIDGVIIVESDITADNGVIHKIDGILSSILVDVPKNSELADALKVCKEDQRQFTGFQLANCVRNVAAGLGSGNVKERPDVYHLPE